MKNSPHPENKSGFLSRLLTVADSLDQDPTDILWRRVKRLEAEVAELKESLQIRDKVNPQAD